MRASKKADRAFEKLAALLAAHGVEQETIALLTREDFVFEFEWEEYQQKIERTAATYEEPQVG